MSKIIIAGIRYNKDKTVYDDYDFVEENVNKFLTKHQIKNPTIISGRAIGIDMLGEAFAHSNQYKVELYPVTKEDWNKHGKRAGHLRNLKMAENATHLIAFWDGESRGTKNMIDNAEKLGLTYEIVMIKEGSTGCKLGEDINLEVLQKEIFNNRETFKKEYIKYIKEYYFLDDTYNDKIDKMFENNFRENNLTVYKSDIGKEFVVNPYDFMKEMLDKHIVSENGAFYLNHENFVNPIIKVYSSLVKDRNRYKKLEKEAEQRGDTVLMKFYNLQQSNVKLIMNTLYGILINPYSKFYNYDIASSTTIRGRSTVSMNALMIESLFGDYVPFDIEAKLQFIRNASKKECKYIDLYKNPTDEELLEHLLKENKNNYYAMDKIKSVISNLTINDRKKVYNTNNFKEFIQLDIIKNALTNIIKIHERDESKIKDIDPKEYKNYIFLDADDPPKSINEDITLVRDIALDILFGMYWYEGGYTPYGRIEHDNQDTIRRILRKRVALIDTDSNIFLLEEDLKDVYNYVPYVKESSMNEEFKELTVCFIIIHILNSIMRQGLDRYTTQSRIDSKHRKMIDYKQEYVFPTLQLTRGSKNYIAKILTREGTYLPKPKIDTKGLPLMKVNFNAFIRKKARYVVENLIAQHKIPDVVNILNQTEIDMDEIIKRIKSTDNIDLFTIKKLKEDEDNVDKYRSEYKAIEVYRHLYKDGDPISLPGYFLITTLDFENREELLKEEYPEQYKILTEYADTKSVARMKRSLLNKINAKGVTLPKPVMDEINQLEKYSLNEVRKLLTKLRKDYKAEMNNFEGNYKDIIKTPTAIKLKNINRIALPLESTEADDFITEFMSTDETAIYQNLISTIMEGLGLVVVPNNTKKGIVHNILSVY